MNIGSLFSGSGMLDEGVRAVLGGEVAWHAEVEPAASRVLAHRYPDVPNLGDITTVDWAAVEPVDVLTGGFPCQDVSHAGKRAGLRSGTRSGLWARMCDAIDQLRPALVVAENVRGLLSAEADSAVEPCPGCVGDRPDGHLRALGRVLGDLADLGYDARWCGLRAADVGAPHGRFRVFIVAASDSAAFGRGAKGRDDWVRPARRDASTAADTSGGSLARPAAARDGLRLAAERRDGSATDASRDGRDEGRPESARLVRGPHAAECGDAPSDADRDALREQPVTEPGRGGQAVAGLPVQWGQYAPAIRRWERVLGRVAPAPTEPGPKGGQRLSPRLTEWMMGWPDGWVTDVPGISRNDALRICGNGVVPQQAAEALRRMLTASAECAA